MKLITISTSFDLSDAEKVEVLFFQAGKKLITKEGNSVDVGENYVKVMLSNSEVLLFEPDRYVPIEVYAYFGEGSIIKSNVMYRPFNQTTNDYVVDAEFDEVDVVVSKRETAKIWGAIDDIKETLLTPKMFGAKGNGSEDDTHAFQSMLDVASSVYIPKGTYVISNLKLKRDTIIEMDTNAVLLQKVASTTGQYLLSLNGFSLTMHGGTINCNTENFSIRPYCIVGSVLHGKKLIFDNVTFRNISKFGVYLSYIGGDITFNGCAFYDTYYSSETNKSGTLVSTQAGETGHKARVTLTNNVAISDSYLYEDTIDGCGGFFFSCRDENNPSSGNCSTVYAENNYFRGFGKNNGINYIYPIHFYPLWSGVRIVNNVFEHCYLGAIAIKSCEETIISGNVWKDGTDHSINDPVREYGIIAYTPAFHANGNERSRAIITGNIIKSACRVGDLRTAGIGVFGDSTTTPHNMTYEVIVSNNLIDDCSYAVNLSQCGDVIVEGNYVTDCARGVRFIDVVKNIVIANNLFNGVTSGIANNSACDAFVSIIGNKITCTENGIYIRGLTECVVKNNFVNNKSGSGYNPYRFGAYDNTVLGVLFFEGNEYDSNSYTSIESGVDTIAGNIVLSSFSGGRKGRRGTFVFDYTNQVLYFKKTATSNTNWEQIQFVS